MFARMIKAEKQKIIHDNKGQCHHFYEPIEIDKLHTYILTLSKYLFSEISIKKLK